MIFEPYNYQKTAIEKIIKNKKNFFIMKMGTGKTICSLTGINELKYNLFEVEKVLLIAPLPVAKITWQEELENWNHLEEMKMVKVLGDKNKRIKALQEKADVYVINIENVTWLIEYYETNKLVWDFDMIVIDESSKFKNRTSKRFKSLKKATVLTDRILLLTGTPISKGYENLWSQIYLLDNGERLGKYITHYRNLYFEPDKKSKTQVFSYKLKPMNEFLIEDKIKDIVYSVNSDKVKMPEIIYQPVYVRMNEELQKLYDSFEDENIIEIEGKNIVATSAGILENKLLQFASGSAYDFYTKETVFVHDLKIEALRVIMEESEEPILVYYLYECDLERLKNEFKEYNPRTLDTYEDKKDWDEGRIRMLLANPVTMQYGLNLQKGGSEIFWYSVPWDEEMFSQANARLARQRARKETVVVYIAICRKTADVRAYNRLKKKMITQEEFIKRMEKE